MTDHQVDTTGVLIALPAASPTTHERTTPVNAGLTIDTHDETDEFLDQLRGWEAQLQVQNERASYRGDQRAEKFGTILAAVRTKLHEVGAAAKASRCRIASRQQATLMDVDATVRRWLCDAHRQEHRAILRRIADDEGLPARMNLADGDHIAAGWRRGYLDAPDTDRVRRLEIAVDASFTTMVVADARRRNGRDESLRHPLIVRRWLETLTALRADAAERAGLASPEALSPLPEGFGSLSREDAYPLLDARRFYVTVQHRWLEAQRLNRRLSLLVTMAHLNDPATRAWQDAGRRAGDTIAERYPDDEALIRYALRRYIRPDGQLDTDGLTTEVRGYLRAEVLGVIAGRLAVAA